MLLGEFLLFQTLFYIKRNECSALSCWNYLLIAG